LHQRFHPKFETNPQLKSVRIGELKRWLRQPLRPNDTVGVENQAANLYSFVPYLVSSAALRIGRVADASPLMLVYLGRGANAAVYLCTFYLAIVIIPDFGLLLLTIGLSPMSLHLAASFSGDSLTLAVTALVTAFIFKLGFDESVRKLRSRDLLFIIVLLTLLALCKLNVWMALLVLLIPPKKFVSPRTAALFIGSCVAASLLTAFIWQTLNNPETAAFQRMYTQQGKSLLDNRTFLLGHPLRFCGMIVFTSVISSWIWLKEFVGVFGWLTIQMSPLHTFMYSAALGLAACSQSGLVRIVRFQKLVLAGFVLLTIVSIHVLLWIFETPVDVLRKACTEWVFVEGIQGRYFLPVALPALVLMPKFPAIRQEGLLQVIVLSVVVVINVLALVGIWQIYS
jgi:uncharacterized membrane protein